jgi:hypothetical protein
MLNRSRFDRARFDGPWLVAPAAPAGPAPDPGRSHGRRTGPDPGRSRGVRLGPDVARSAGSRTGPDPGRSHGA